ncbi:hypothetical protein X403_03475 [Mycobacterium tuberculosis XTB13-197]|uniref:DUF3018 family protein n=3 Tax=Mycobacterium tuberculosis TaxID=1773 RepID=A5U5Z6_MYCTA|nr:hypothetical protein MT2721 [Mycobacterium tuberculosis CDC1551]ABQ74446.1 hypothetical protein MRA_2673 [Mycobacterium tuberculosis H37Ra]ABR06989.1 hypothetical protein TBFG_12662 [Mycobacterium tuberculosis F11]ACT24378.1 conserved hypothetical protein [Mycobacterium tuberculosis KZN 1435]AEB03467.1 conserved hypothetical protein [Mycobacterium tuberculosis KZN 4207]AFM48714.1 hypothetical protein TBXG_001317 [Mycobacterium tuberculosis KZN 605]AFN50617.1 hypothetical protein RVBD_2643A
MPRSVLRRYVRSRLGSDFPRVRRLGTSGSHLYWLETCRVAALACVERLVKKLGPVRPYGFLLICPVRSLDKAAARDRVRRYRERLRQRGLRPIQIWVPDVNAPEFVGEAHRPSALVAAREYEDDDQAFVDAVSVDWDDAT